MGLLIGNWWIFLVFNGIVRTYFTSGLDLVDSVVCVIEESMALFFWMSPLLKFHYGKSLTFLVRVGFYGFKLKKGLNPIPDKLGLGCFSDYITDSKYSIS